MNIDNRGRLRLVALVGLLLAGAGVTLAAGFVIADDQQSGDDILSDVQETYNTADSVAGNAVVSVETDEETIDATVGFVTAGEDKSLLNVSNSQGYVLTGTDGTTAWVYDPVTELTGAIDRTGDDVSFSLRTGTEDPIAGTSSLFPGSGIDGETTVEELREQLGDQLPAEFDQQLADVSNDTTLTELPEEIDSDFAALIAGDDTELPEEFTETALEGLDGEFPEEFNETAFEEFDGEPFEKLNESTLDELTAQLPAEINESTIAAFGDELEAVTEGTSLEALEFDSELPSEINKSTVESFTDRFLTAVENGAFDDILPEEAAAELSDRAAELEDAEFEETTTSPEDVRDELSAALPDEIDALNEYESFEALADDLEAVANKTAVQLVSTTTVDGEEAHELLVTHPDVEGETRLYTSVETDEILRQVTTTPEVTVTIDVTETQFDVSPADSTFEPRGTTELASFVVETAIAETPAAIDDAAPFAAAVPDDSWTLERGAVTTTNGSLSIPGLSLPTESFETSVAAGLYADDEQTLTVTQRPAPAWLDETSVSELAEADLTSAIEAELGTELAFDTEVNIEATEEIETTTTTVGDREIIVTTSAEGTAATWVEDSTVVTVTSDLDRADLESVIAAIEIGIDG